MCICENLKIELIFFLLFDWKNSGCENGEAAAAAGFDVEIVAAVVTEHIRGRELMNLYYKNTNFANLINKISC